MAKITVNIKAFHGYSCGFQSHESEETVEVEISDNEFAALKKLGKEQITAEDIVAAIESGDKTLESLHELLSEKFYYMIEEYWLYEADNECLYECLAEHIEQDISDGLYTPEMSDNDEDDYDIEECEDEELDNDDKVPEVDESEEDDYGDDEDYEEDEDNYDLDAYFDWVKEHDHEFAAERVGLDLDACREDEVNYSINLEN